MRRKRRRQKMIRKMVYTAILVLGFLLIVLGLLSFLLGLKKVHSAKVEAGSELTLTDFLKKEKYLDSASFVTDMSTIDTAVPGTYELQIAVGKKTYKTKVTIQDTIAPTAESADATTQLKTIPEAESLVTNITDATAVTVSYLSEPDVSKEGSSPATVVLTDAAGNTTQVDVTVNVVNDTEAPVISGAIDLEVYAGDSVQYKKYITVTDDKDSDPELKVDNSGVDLDTPGSYQVTYTATDAAGNQSSVTITLKVSEKTDTYVELDTVLELAQQVYDEIITDDMDDLQKTFAIYNWVNKHISYTGTSDKTSWTRGAYDAFTNRVGDCYNYFAAAKALYTVAGIQNCDIVKSDTSHSQHFWSLVNLGDGWYHVDCTPRAGTGDNFFMLTDAELEAYSSAHNNCHIFDSSLYPERATTSIQYMVDYKNRTLDENATPD